MSSMGCAVFGEEEITEEGLQTGIEVGAECMETRPQGPGATVGSRSSLSSECCMLLAHLLSLSFSLALFDPRMRKVALNCLITLFY
jgi:hypothetical protein